MRWVAFPATVCAEIRKACRALSLARSIEKTAATPRATPTTLNISCRGCRER